MTARENGQEALEAFSPHSDYLHPFPLCLWKFRPLPYPLKPLLDSIISPRIGFFNPLIFLQRPEREVTPETL